MGFLQPQTQTAQKTASSSGGFLQQSGQTLAPSKPTAKHIGKTTTPTPTKSPTQQVKGFISKASSKVPEEALIRKPIDIYKKIISTGLRVADKQLGVSKKVDTFQKVALKTGKVLQKAPDVNLGTFFKLKELPKTKVASKTLEPEDKIVNFISNFPSAVARQYGTDIELVSTKEGRNLLKRDAKNLPKTMSQVKTHIDNKEWQKAFETAMSNTALVVALDAGGLIPTGLIAKGVTALRSRKVAQEVVKEAVEQAEKEAVKKPLKVVSAKELGFKEPKPKGVEVKTEAKPKGVKVEEAGLYDTGNYLYHGTGKVNLESIAREGLRPGLTSKKISLSKTEPYAQSFADSSQVGNKANGVMLRVNQDLIKGKILPSKSCVK